MQTVPHSKARGFTIVEAIIASSIALIVILGVVGAFTSSLTASTGIVNRIQASFLEEEGQEVVRFLRDDSWTTNIAGQTMGSPFYLVFSGSAWKATSTTQYIDGKFVRSVTIDNVYRNSSQDIVTSGGTLDSNTKKVTVSVAWYDHGATTSRSLQTYLTNIFSN